MKKRILYWAPRIIGILSLLFMLMFSFDAFEGNEPLVRKLEGFFIHNTPVLMLTGILIFAWKREFTGGIVFVIIASAAALYLIIASHKISSLVVLLPFVLTGVLFMINGRLRTVSQRNNIV